MPSPVVLTIPADPAYIHVARAVATSFASDLALPLDRVEDLRLAAAEACNWLLEAATDGAQLRIDLDTTDGQLRTGIGLDRPADRVPTSRLSWALISKLADAAWDERAADVPRIVMTWRLLPTDGA
jgi:hypothetical protein